LRAALDDASVEIVAINDLVPTATNAHLLRYDSTQGNLRVPVSVGENALQVGEHTIKVFAERDPAALPWGELDIDVVIESTGIFTSREAAAKHLTAGAKRVIISAPSGDADATFVMGVNENTFNADTDLVISNASCTTNCFVPMVKVLDDAFGVEAGLMTTVHAYTNDQNLLDLAHKDLRRARAAAINIVPTATGAARATSLVLSSMKGKLDGTSLRVPIPVGSITDFTAVLPTTTVDAVNEAFRAAAEGALAGFLVYTAEPIVSSDIVGSPASCTFDSLMTMVQPIDDTKCLVKVFGWYDNEWGYSNRLVDLARYVAH
jgi:glyceraldehyde 3-phosphate dehydrogenase